MDLARRVSAFDDFQQSHRWTAVPIAVVKKVGDDQAGNLAALVAYYAFFSLFPLLLVFVTILGFVLQGDPSAQHSIEKSVLGQFPIVGTKIQVTALHGRTVALVIGLAISLWSGLAVTRAAQNAFDAVWMVPFKDRSGFVHSRLRGLGVLVTVGVLFIAATAASGLVSGGLGGPLLAAAGIVISLLLNFALFLAAFRLMTAGSVPTRSLWSGVIVAAILWELLQLVGGYYIGHVLKNTTSTYAQFGFVIALLVWLHLGAQVTLYAAELNVVLARGLWPRSLTGPPVPADEKALRGRAKVQERSDRERVDVHFRHR